MARREYTAEFRLDARKSSGFSKAFREAQKELEQFQQEYKRLSSVQKDISAYQKQQAAIAATAKKLQNLAERQALYKQEIAETKSAGESTTALERKELELAQQIQSANIAIERQKQGLEKTSAALKAAKVNTGDLSGEAQKLASQMEDVKKKLTDAGMRVEELGEKSGNAFGRIKSALTAVGIVRGLKEVYEWFSACADAAVEYESAVTGVYKTVEGSSTQLGAISEGIQEMSTEIPATTTEIAAVAEAAGQLGIATDDVLDFTRVMIDLGEATNLTSDEAASALAKFSNITGTAASDYSRLGSTVVGLGNNFATTEADIVEMATRLASAGTLAGLTEAEIMALATAMSSVGIEADAGGTAMTQTLSAVETAVVQGGKDLQKFAEIAGVSAEEFASTWRNRPTAAIQSFIAGLGALDQKGESAVLVLDELGLSGVRQSNMLKSLGLASNTLSNAIELANTAWRENVALTEEANKRYATTASQQAMMQNAYNNLKVAIGDKLTPALREFYALATEVLSSITEFIQKDSVEDKISALTATFREQYYQMQDLEEQYGEICATMGETSSKAQLLKAKLDEETEAFRANSETQEEYLEQRGKVLSAYEEQASAYDATIVGIEQEWAGTQNLISRLTQLTEAEYQSAAAKQEILAIVDILNERIPELGLNYDMLTGKLNVTPEEVMHAARVDVDKNRKEADYQALTGAMQNESGLQQQYQKDYENQMAAYKLLQRKKKELEDLKVWEKYSGSDGSSGYRTPTGGVISEYEHGEMIGEVQGEINQAEAEWEAAKAVANESKAAWDDNIATQHELAESLATVSEETDAAVQPISELQGCTDELKASMSQLAAAYDDAYYAALESVSGQYALWDEADDIVAMSASSINTALESQIEHWQTYNANLANLGDRAADIEGLNEMLATFADGSAESINAVAGMAEASDEDLLQMVANWQMLQQEQQTTATNLAEVKTGITEVTDEMLREYTDAIKDMDLSDEAKESASSTILAFIEAADEMLPQVQAAYARLGNAALYALGQGTYIQPEGRQSRTGRTMYEANATGTTYAADAFIAGEEGPELILGRRGASVFPVQETQRIIDAIPHHGNGGSTQITFAPVYHLEGVSSAADLEAVLRDHDTEMREYIQQVIADAEKDTSRRRY